MEDSSRSGPPRPVTEPGPQSQLATHGGVTRPELFLDLVFVYAFINVTNLMSESPNVEGLIEGGLLVLLLWRVWASYAWLGNLVRLDRDGLPHVVFALTTVILIAGVAIPEAFTDRPGGESGPVVFVIAFLLARLGPLVIAALASGRVPGARAPLGGWLPLAGSIPLLLCAALLPDHLPGSVNARHVQLMLFLVATAVDYASLWARNVGSWRLRVGHWTERHSLIMLIALGETIISIGTSRGLVGDPPITWSVLVGSVFGIVVVALLWWTYFDIARLGAEQALARTEGVVRSRLGRDAYTVLHMPMIVGLTFLALGLKHALSATEVPTAYLWDTLDVLVLYGGVVLYLLGLVAFEWRTLRYIGRSPLLGIVLILLLAPLADGLPVLGSLGLLASALSCMAMADRTVFRRRHHRLHDAVAPAHEADVTPRELFLDLIFVYAFIQVTVLMTRQPSAVGVAQGLAVLALLWWSWCLYAWLATVALGEATLVRLSVLVAVTLTLIVGIATPQAFSYVPGGLSGPLIVVICYVAVRVLHLATFWLQTRGNPAARAQVLRAAVPGGVAMILLLYAVLTAPRQGDPVTPAGVACWLAALIIDLGGGYLIGPRNWRLPSLRHWVARYNLIILIALGEAVISVGVAVADLPISAPTIAAIVLTATLLSTCWWTYVGTDVILGHRFAQLRSDLGRAALARDAYTYLHLFMVVGLVLVAFGLRLTLTHVGRQAAPAALGQVTLACGLIVFFLADLLAWRRTRQAVGRRRALRLLVAVFAPATAVLPELWALAALTLAVLAAVVVGRGGTGAPDTTPHRADGEAGGTPAG